MPGFRRKVMVDIEQIEHLIQIGKEAQDAVPVSMQEADEIIRQKDSIINQANLEANRIKGAADEQAALVRSSAQQEHMVKVSQSEIVREAEVKGEGIKGEATSEAHQIIQDAQRRAYQILNEAEDAASVRREGADQYAREVLFNLESQLAEVLGQVRKGIDTLRLDSRGQQVSSQPNNGQKATP